MLSDTQAYKSVAAALEDAAARWGDNYKDRLFVDVTVKAPRQPGTHFQERGYQRFQLVEGGKWREFPKHYGWHDGGYGQHAIDELNNATLEGENVNEQLGQMGIAPSAFNKFYTD